MSYRRFLAVLLSVLTVLGTVAVATPVYAWGTFTGPWHIRNKHSGLCLSIYLGSKRYGAPAVQVPCNDNYPATRGWYAAGFHFENGYSRCLKVTGDSMDDDVVAVQMGCEYAPPHTENWLMVIESLPFTGWVHLVNEHTGKCLMPFESSTVMNAAIVQYTCDFALPSQEWKLEAV
jgi:hypothetical protein